MNHENPLVRLGDFGQSVWLDYIERGFVRDGGLATLIADDGVSGVTSNPAIFQKAIADHQTYDEEIKTLALTGLGAPEIYEALIIEDIQLAADTLHPVYVRSGGLDGFVSLEVSPHLARDTEATHREAKRLWALVNRENMMVKIPGTQEGIAAIRRSIADGINVNITLLFSVERYAEVATAFITGLEDRVRQGYPIDRVASVASFFLSRIDASVDPRLENSADPELRKLQGECAIMCARAAYAHFQFEMASSRWSALANKGARPQRLLWASTGTKDRRYSDVKYVDSLVGPDTVTTLPPETLAAYRDHGRPVQRLISHPGADVASTAVLEGTLAKAGVDWRAVVQQLESDGIQKFIQPHEAVLRTLGARLAQLETA